MASVRFGPRNQLPPQLCHSDPSAEEEESRYRWDSTVESNETLRFVQGDICGVRFGSQTWFGRAGSQERSKKREDVGRGEGERLAVGGEGQDGVVTGDGDATTDAVQLGEELV